MARAQRHFLPGYLWHLTHRCHRREFLLKFAKDRDRYLHHLYKAKMKYGLSVLNYMATCNHVHLLVSDNGDAAAIPRSMQHIAGRTGQEYNKRKGRKGAFWQDRYHATAIGKDKHFLRCMIYIDLNMVRAGVVRHPAEWRHSGYNEIQTPRERYRIIDRERLREVLCLGDGEELGATLKGWIEEALRSEENVREERWTQSVAVGDRAFITHMKEKLADRGRGRKIEEEEGKWVLREAEVSYEGVFANEKAF